MVQARWNGSVIAEADMDRCQNLEGNIYFPADAVVAGHLVASATHTLCPWKGTASYFDVVVDGKVNKDAAWYYPAPTPEAAAIKGHIAFWHGIGVE